ncbi:MAG: acyltransferase [Thermodesulfobacteriota bacterium]
MSKCAKTYYRRDIDGLRAIAVLGVVLFHAYPELMPGGFIGVDVFFVISGFLITKQILQRSSEKYFYLRFLLRRLGRTVPALFLMVCGVVLLGYFLLLPAELFHLSRHIVVSSFFSTNFLLWREDGYFDVSSIEKPLLHLWSLSIEEQFYFIWPIFLITILIYFKKPLWPVFVLTILSLALCVYITPLYHAAAFYLAPFRFWELMMGGLIAIMNVESYIASKPKLSAVLSFTGITLLVVSMVFMSPQMNFPGSLALFPVAGAVFLISATDLGPINRIFLSLPLLVGIGLISYSLYLWHWPLLSLVRIVQLNNPPSAIILAAVIVSFLLAVLSWKFVETPFRNWSKLVLKK